MKKLFTAFLAALLILSLAACSGGETTASTGGASSNPQNTSSAKDPNQGQSSIKDGVELLTKVWNSHKEDEKFAVAGGDMSEENMTMDAPGKFGVEDAASLDVTLGLPEASAGKIDGAASLVHMMNANTFTCGAFHVKNAGDISALAGEIKENIMNREWMCGFPDKLVIAKVDGYIVSFFGMEEIVDTFKAHLTEVYSSAEIICDDPVVSPSDLARTRA